MKVFNEYATTGIDYRTFRVMIAIANGTSSSDQNLAEPDSPYTRALYSQFLHETGNATSRVFRELNNLFGMRPAQKRPKYYVDTQDTAHGTYAVYKDVIDSIADRLDLDRYNNILYPKYESDVQSYFTDILAKGYATDPNYLRIVLDMYKKQFSGIQLGDLEDYSDQQDAQGAPTMGNGDKKSLSKFIIPIIVALAVGIYIFLKKRKPK